MIVTGGLGSPRRGNLAAFGYGLAVPAPLGPIRAALTGAGSLAGALDALLPGTYISAVLAGSGGAEGSLRGIADVSALLAGSGQPYGQLDGIDFNRYMQAYLNGSGSITGPLDGVDFNRYIEAALSGSGELTADRTAKAWLETILSGSGELGAVGSAVGHIGASTGGSGAVAGLLAERLWRLLTPATEDKNAWQTYWARDVRKTLVRLNGEWLVVRNPDEGLLARCDRVYRGGFEHLLTTDLAQELAAAGFDVQLED